MLYDKRWEKPEVKADPFSIGSLIAWLEGKPSAENYDFLCAGQCLLGQWVATADPLATIVHKSGAEPFFYRVHGQIIDLCQFDQIALGDGLSDEWTFGAALERARNARCPQETAP